MGDLEFLVAFCDLFCVNCGGIGLSSLGPLAEENGPADRNRK